MQTLFIHARNSTFHSRDEGAEYEHPETALALGVRSAIAMIADEINGGERSAAVEVSVERADGTQVLCSVVATSVSPLMPADHPSDPPSP